MQRNNYCSFNILLHRIKWNDIRLVWIGFYKNDNNIQCVINLLSEDVIRYIIKFIGFRSNMKEGECTNESGVFEIEL